MRKVQVKKFTCMLKILKSLLLERKLVLYPFIERLLILNEYKIVN